MYDVTIEYRATRTLQWLRTRTEELGDVNNHLLTVATDFDLLHRVSVAPVLPEPLTRTAILTALTTWVGARTAECQTQVIDGFHRILTDTLSEQVALSEVFVRES